MSFSSANPSRSGIDFGGTSVKLGLVQAGGLTQRAESLPTLAYETSRHLLTAILGAIDDLRARHPDIAAVGAGLPGIVDSRRGVVHHLTNVPGWVNVPLRDLLAMHTGLPAIVENDANAMTYAEWKFGRGPRAAKRRQRVTLGTGVGAGLILNGELYRGSQLGAGEIGPHEHRLPRRARGLRQLRRAGGVRGQRADRRARRTRLRTGRAAAHAAGMHARAAGGGGARGRRGGGGGVGGDGRDARCGAGERGVAAQPGHDHPGRRRWRRRGNSFSRPCAGRCASG